MNARGREKRTETERVIVYSNWLVLGVVPLACRSSEPRGGGGGDMQAAVLKLKALPHHTQAKVSRLSADVRAKVAAKKKERAASKEAKNASAGGAASSATAAAESAGSAGQGMQKIRALNQAARRSASKLSASFSKKGRYTRHHVARFTPPASHLRSGT